MPFEEKILQPQKRICIRLRECREAKKIPIADIVRRTRISRKYIEAIERCEFDQIPFSHVYQKNFVRRYAEAIGLPSEPFLVQFIAEEAPRTPASSNTHRSHSAHLSNVPSTIRFVTITLMVCALIGYLGFQIFKSIQPPHLVILSPQEGSIAATHQIPIQGSTEREASVSVNGMDIRTNTDGQFNEPLYLSPGINTIVVTARKKHGKSTTLTRHVVLKDLSSVSLK